MPKGLTQTIPIQWKESAGFGVLRASRQSNDLSVDRLRPALPLLYRKIGVWGFRAVNVLARP